MIVKVILDKETKEIELPKGSAAQTLLNSLGLPPDAFIISRNGTPIPITETLSEGDKVKLIRVASGG
jgi:sulfur carrier protein ThiS